MFLSPNADTTRASSPLGRAAFLAHLAAALLTYSQIRSRQKRGKIVQEDFALASQNNKSKYELYEFIAAETPYTLRMPCPASYHFKRFSASEGIQKWVTKISALTSTAGGVLFFNPSSKVTVIACTERLQAAKKLLFARIAALRVSFLEVVTSSAWEQHIPEYSTSVKWKSHSGARENPTKMDWRQHHAGHYPPYGHGYHPPPPNYGHGPPPHYPPSHYPPPPPQPKLLGVGLDEALLGSGNVHSKNVNSLGWSSGGGQRLATGSDDKTARVYDVDGSGQVKPLLKLDGHQDAVVQVRDYMQALTHAHAPALAKKESYPHSCTINSLDAKASMLLNCAPLKRIFQCSIEYQSTRSVLRTCMYLLCMRVPLYAPTTSASQNR